MMVRLPSNQKKIYRSYFKRCQNSTYLPAISASQTIARLKRPNKAENGPPFHAAITNLH